MKINRNKIIIISILFTIIGIYGLFKEVSANSTIDENGTIWEYDINEDGNAEIYKLSGEIPEYIIIPSDLEGHKVVKVRNKLFLLRFVWK